MLIRRKSCKVLAPNPTNDFSRIVLIFGKPQLTFLPDNIKYLIIVSILCIPRNHLEAYLAGLIGKVGITSF